MGSERANSIANLLEVAMANTTKAAEGIAADKRMTQAKEGKSHPTWQLGHMTLVMANGVMGLCLGKPSPVPNEYGPLFAPSIMGGQPPTADASAYPAWDELLATYKAVGKEVVAAVRNLDDSELAGAPRGPVPEVLQDRMKVLGDGIMFFALHNSYHMGQMNLLAAL